MKPWPPAFPDGPKLGKLDKEVDERTLQLMDFVHLDFLTAKLPTEKVSPLSFDQTVISWPMYENDQISDCGPAAGGHLVQGRRDQVARAEKKPSPRAPTDDEIIEFYVAVTKAQGAAFDPTTEDNDTGVSLLTLLKVAQQVGIGGDKWGPFVEVPVDNFAIADWASCAFGGLLQGYQLPVICQDGRPWTFVPPNLVGPEYVPGGWGGHATAEVKNTLRGGMADASWGALYAATRGFKQAYRDEAYAVIDPAWIEEDGAAPSWLKVAELKAALTEVRG